MSAAATPADRLTDGQTVALDNLARKQAGEVVGWINISAAQALTELGLARRSAEGWSITAEGLMAIAASGPVATAPISLAQHRLSAVHH